MADHLKGDVSGTLADFDKLINGVEDRVRKKNTHFAGLMVTRTKAKASGRPGPNAPTGDYRSKIDAAEFNHTDKIGFVAGTDDKRGRRLELGFGKNEVRQPGSSYPTKEGREDKLGRVYHQPPYPHFGPALDELEGAYEKAIGDCIDEATR